VTKVELDKLRAGSKLDGLVSQDVMGVDPIKVCEYFNDSDHDELHCSLPGYSTDMTSAMTLLDELRKKGHRVLINIDDAGFHLRRVAFVHHDGIKDEKNYTCDMPLWTAKKLSELPKAICLAALKLVYEAEQDK